MKHRIVPILIVVTFVLAGTAQAQPPANFNLFSPANGATVLNDTVYVWWNASVDPDGGQLLYHVNWSTHSDFASFYSGTTLNNYFAITDLADQIMLEYEQNDELDELPDSTHIYWRVKAVDDENDETWATPQAGWWFYVALNQPPGDFSLLQPQDEDTCWTGDTTLVWQSTSDPDGLNINYRVYMATDSLFTENLISPITGDTTYTRNGMTDDETYYWKIMATDGQPHGQTWSNEVWEFHVYIPEPPTSFNLLTPADEDTVWQTNATLTWQASTEPDPDDSLFYRIYWATDAAFTQDLDSADVNPPTTQVDIAGLSDDQTYFWKVKAIDTNSNGTWSNQTNEFHVFVNEPPNAFDLSAPPNLSVQGDDSITVSWTASSDPDPNDAVTYHVQWSLHDDFSSYWSGETTNTTYDLNDEADQAPMELDELTDDTLYYWRVYAEDNYGFQTWATPDTGWAFYTQYHPDPPRPFNLTGPADGDTCWTGDTTLTWQASSDPDPGDPVQHYVVWWATDAAFTQNLDSATVNVPNLSFDLNNLTDDTEYYWKVRAQDGNTNGTWSTQTWSFHVYIPQNPGAFALATPADGATIANDTVTVTWTASTDPDPGDPITYHVEWSQQSDFSSSYTGSTSNTTFDITDLQDLMPELDELPDDITLYWRVRAVDRFGLQTWATPQAGWSFDIYIPDPPNPFDLAAPANNDTCWTGDTTFVWRTATEPDPGDAIQSHKIWWATDPAFTQNLDSASVNAPDTSYTLNNMLDDETYYWKVRAQDGNTEGTWSNQTWNLKVYIPEFPGAYTLASPPDGGDVHNDTVTVSWNPSTDPDPGDPVTYHVEWSVHSDFSSFYTGSTSDTFYTINDLANQLMPELDELPDDTTIYWRVRAVDRFGQQTWATPQAGWSFNVYLFEPPAAFDLVSPLNSDTCWTGDTTLVWQSTTDPDPGDPVQRYVVWYATNPTFSDNLDSVSVNAPDTTLDLVNLIDDETYYWSVRAQDGNTNGTWANQTNHFKVYAPEAPGAFTLESPINGAVIDDDTVTVRWSESTDPDPNDLITYQVQWSEYSDFSSFYTGSTTDTFFVISDLQNLLMPPGEIDELPDDTTIYWRVRADDRYGEQTWCTPAAGWSFDIYITQPPDPFDLLHPGDGDTCWTGDTTLTWQATTDPDPGDAIQDYVIWWATNATFTQNLDSSTVPAGQTTYDLNNLTDHTTYYWKVRANDTNTTGRWSSQTRSLHVYIPHPPNAFNLLSPADGDTCWDGDTTLTWQAAVDTDPNDAVEYVVWWASDAAFTQDLDSATVAGTSHPLNNLPDNSTWYWKVRAQDLYTTGTWSSQTNSFHVYIPDDPTAFNLAEPTDEAIVNDDTVTVRWTSSTDADPGDVITYTAHWSLDHGFATYYQGSTTDTFLTITDMADLMPELDELPDDARIYWRVRAADRFGTIVDGTPSSGWSFYVAAEPDPPQPFSLLNPGDLDTCWTGDTTLTWQAATDTDPGDNITYKVWWATDAGFTQNLDSASTANTTYNLTNLLDDETYWWKVRAQDTNTSGTWSTQTWRIPVYLREAPGAFTLASPADEDTVHYPSQQIIWNPSTDPDPGDSVSYRVEWSMHSDFSALNTATTGDTSYTLSDLINQAPGELDDLPDSTHIYWRVVALDRIGNETTCTPNTGRSFYTRFWVVPEPFSLLSPGDGDTCFTGDTTLTWEATTDRDPGDTITNYVVWYATNPAFTQNLDSLITVGPVTSIDINNLNDNTTYYWKVRANDTNTDGRWSSETWSLRVSIPGAPGAFTLAGPADSSSIADDTVTVYWNPSIDPDPGDTITYSVEWSTDPTFTSSYTGTTRDTFYTINGLQDQLDEIPEDSTIYWRVEAVDLVGLSTTGTPTSGWSFTVYFIDPPQPFSLLSPGDGDTVSYGGDTTLVWETAIEPDPDDSTEYVVWWAYDNAFSSGLDSITTSDTTYHIAGLLDDSTYYWKVRAQDNNSSGTWSTETFSFYANFPSQPEAFSLLNPVDDDTNFSGTATMTWEETYDTDPNDDVTYRIWLAADSTFSLDADSSNTGADTAYTFDVINGVSYWWKVRAQDTNSAGTWSDEIWTLHTNVTDAPAYFDLAEPAMLDSVQNDTVTVTWQPAIDPQGGQVTYEVEWSADSLYGVSFTATTNDTFYTISDLSNPVFWGEELDELPDDAQVYWRVLATDEQGYQTRSQPVAGNRFNVYLFDPPTAFNLLDPPDQSTVHGADTTLAWESAQEVDPGDTLGYVVWWALDDSFAMNADSATVTDTSYNATGLINDVTYHWKVRAQDSNTPGTWSTDTFTFDVDNPNAPESFTLGLPVNGEQAHNDTVLVRWYRSSDPLGGGDMTYTVEWSLNPQFANAYTATTTDSAYFITDLADAISDLDELPDDITVYWRVLATAAGGLQTYCSPVDGWTFDVYLFEPPTEFTLVEPADGDTAWADSMLVVWTPSTDPDPGDSVLYEICWDTDRNFSEPCSTDVHADTSYYITGLHDDSVYYINIHAFDTHGHDVYTDTVAIYVFIPDGPAPFELLTPADGEVVQEDTVSVTWSSTSDADALEQFVYQVQWSLDPAFGDFFYADSLTDTTFTITDLQQVFASRDLDELPDDSTIHWRVKAYDIFSAQRFADPAGGWEFTVYLPEAPSAFSLISPADDDTCWTGDTTMVWERSIDPDPAATIEYLLITAADEAFTQDLDTVATADTSYAFTGLPNHTDRYWKVYARDNDGLGTWSDQANLLHVFVPLAPEPFELVSPTSGTVFHHDSVQVTWRSTTDSDPGDAVRYRVEWSENMNFSNSATFELQDTTFLITELPSLVQSGPDDEGEMQRLERRGRGSGRSETEAGSRRSSTTVSPSGSRNGSMQAASSSRRKMFQDDAHGFDGQGATTITGKQSGRKRGGDTHVIHDPASTPVVFPEHGDNELNELPDDATVYWRVYALDRYGMERVCSPEAGWVFHTDIGEPPAAFALLSPGNGDIVNDTLAALTWEAAVDPDPGDALHYVIYWATDSQFTTGLDSTTSNTAGFTLPGLENHRDYWWKVRAQDTNSYGTWSNQAYRFYVALERPPAAFSLLSPANGSLVDTRNARLEWEEAAESDTNDTVEYVVYLSDTDDFSGAVDSTVTAFTSTPLTALQDMTRYWWKVRAQDTNTEGTWSDRVFSFLAHRPDPPAPFAQLSPANEDTVRTPFALLEWEEAVDGDAFDQVSYEVIWALSSDLRDSVVVHTRKTFYLAAGMDSSSNGSHGTLPDDSRIYWKVRAYDLFDLSTPADPPGAGVWSFYTDIPDAPAAFDLASPLDGDTLNPDSLALSWNSSIDPDPYDEVLFQVWLDTLADFSTAQLMADSLADTTFRIDALEGYRTYYWAVRATDSNTSGTWSDTLSFYVPFINTIPDPWQGTPTEFGVPGTYPNPFNASATIVVSLPVASDLTVRVYDVLGRRVAELAEGRFPAGYQKLSFNANGLPSGVYFLHAAVPGHMDVKRRIVLVR